MMRNICYLIASVLVCAGAWCIVSLDDLSTGIFVAIIALVFARILVMDVADGVLSDDSASMSDGTGDGLVESNS